MMSTGMVRFIVHVAKQPKRPFGNQYPPPSAAAVPRQHRSYSLTACRPFSSSPFDKTARHDRGFHSRVELDGTPTIAKPRHRLFDTSTLRVFAPSSSYGARFSTYRHHSSSSNTRSAVSSVVIARAISTLDAPFPTTPPVEECKKPSFEDPSVAHGAKSVTEIIRAIGVFKVCQIRPLVKNADNLLSYSKKILGSTITDAVMKISFFKHFCAGEDVNSIKPAIDMLKQNGIGGILDYAAESDDHDKFDGANAKEILQAIITNPPYNQPARVYDYKSEEQCDRHVEVFLSCIHAVRDVTPTGFAALKVTALGNPQLLERMSVAINELKKLFALFDLDNDGVVTRQEFTQGYRLVFCDANEKLPELLERLDPEGTNKVDYISWAKLLTPRDIPRITKSCRRIGTLSLAAPSNEEIDLMEAMHDRAFRLAEEAFQCKVRLLIDAEHTRFQPAIDNLVLELQQKYNSIETTNVPTIFNTYQCYLKDTPMRIMTDVERSRRFRYHFAAKLVRGAYMVGERAKAKELGVPNPIHDNIENTHKCYNEAIEYLLRYRVDNDSGLEIMCATHNQDSIMWCMDLMHELGIHAKDNTVHFAQLYGMSDNLTFTLGKNGYRAYKYVPYGKVEEVMPYLLRRAQENSEMLGNASKEIHLLYAELKKRMFHR